MMGFTICLSSQPHNWPGLLLHLQCEEWNAGVMNSPEFVES